LDGEVPVPSPRPSPPQETKVSQQSQDIDDIDRRNGRQSSQDHGDAAATPAVPDNVTPSDAQAQTGIPSPTHVATNTELQNQPEIVKVSATGEVDAKAPTGETNVPASVEPAATSPVTEEANVPVAASAKHISPPEIDNQNQPNSHADTGTGAGSNTRETKRLTPPLSEADGATKRPREDEDGDLDPNPREAKRASPPPEKEKEKEKKEKPTRKKSGSDARAPSAPASPRSKPVSVFVRRLLSSFLFFKACLY
jgi:Ran-binding protein 3